MTQDSTPSAAQRPAATRARTLLTGDGVSKLRQHLLTNRDLGEGERERERERERETDRERERERERERDMLSTD